MSLLSVRGLARDFDGLRAVDGVALDIPAGEVRALIGPNGAGKTTLVGMIAGRIAPSGGRVILDGRDITRLPAHRRMRLGMAYTFQITSVFQGLSVEENVTLAARRRLRGAELGRAVQEALDRVGLAARAGQLAGDLAARRLAGRRGPRLERRPEIVRHLGGEGERMRSPSGAPGSADGPGRESRPRSP